MLEVFGIAVFFFGRWSRYFFPQFFIDLFHLFADAFGARQTQKRKSLAQLERDSCLIWSLSTASPTRHGRQGGGGLPEAVKVCP